jgi:hypothetical protein
MWPFNISHLTAPARPDALPAHPAELPSVTGRAGVVNWPIHATPDREMVAALPDDSITEDLHRTARRAPTLGGLS